MCVWGCVVDRAPCLLSSCWCRPGLRAASLARAARTSTRFERARARRWSSQPHPPWRTAWCVPVSCALPSPSLPSTLLPAVRLCHGARLGCQSRLPRLLARLCCPPLSPPLPRLLVVPVSPTRARASAGVVHGFGGQRGVGLEARLRLMRGVGADGVRARGRRHRRASDPATAGGELAGGCGDRQGR